jgi:hypothetical protein
MGVEHLERMAAYLYTILTPPSVEKCSILPVSIRSALPVFPPIVRPRESNYEYDDHALADVFLVREITFY